MKTYHVQWSIDIEAESPREAAEKAREIQLDPESTATVFKVRNYSFYDYGVTMISNDQIDLEESIEEQ